MLGLAARTLDAGYYWALGAKHSSWIFQALVVLASPQPAAGENAEEHAGAVMRCDRATEHCEGK